MNDLLYPTCPECGLAKGIEVARVGPASRDGYHDVDELDLHCGHTVDAGELDESIDRLEDGVVDMIRLTRPDVIDVVR